MVEQTSSLTLAEQLAEANRNLKPVPKECIEKKITVIEAYWEDRY